MFDRPTTDAKELFLLRLRYREGRLIAAGSDKPILLDQPETAWVVYRGKVDIFSVAIADGAAIGTRTHVMRLESGQAFFGMSLGNAQHGLLAVGHAETTLIQLRRSSLQKLTISVDFRLAIVEMLDGWVTGLYAGLNQTLMPKASAVDVAIKPKDKLDLAETAVVSPQRGVVWIRQEGGTLSLIGEQSLTFASGILPLAATAWLQANRATMLQGLTTQQFLQEDSNWRGLDSFQQLVLTWVRLNAAQTAVSERNRLDRKGALAQANMRHSLLDLAAILAPDAKTADLASADHVLLEAVKLVGQASHILVQVPAQTYHTRFLELVRAANIRAREIALRGRWWETDSGPFVAYWEDSEEPVALLPIASGSYELVDPATGARQPVAGDVAAMLKPFGYMLYRAFPDKQLGIRDLLRFAAVGISRDLRMILLMAVGIGVLGLLIPVGTGVLVDSIIPSADLNRLWMLSAVLVAMAVATAVFQLTRSYAVLRIQGKLNLSLQAALWDRLLHLPLPFFQRYSTGDLAQRVNGMQAIQDMIAGTAVSSLLDGITAVAYLFLLFYYDAALAQTAFGLTAVAVFVTTFLGYYTLRYERTLTNLEGRTSGQLLQFLHGLSKFRIAGGEETVFRIWTKSFAAQKQLSFKIRTLQNNLVIFSAAYPIITAIVIFSTVLFLTDTTLTTGEFIGFYTAFSLFLASALGVTLTLVAILKIVPTYERLVPILQTLPETNDAQADPGELSGAIELNSISFRYSPDGPTVIDDLSFSINPGEFVALVGSSGAGKSTIFRFLLGFDQPETGSVYYDGQDLASLDVQAVRQQIGTVLQHGKLISGDILNNIIGSRSLTLNDAWEAARLAGVEKDIRAMPMGMHTVVSEGASTFSGGQRQRLLIARAIVNKPRIILFDEATSALDNQTQAIITESLEQLQATRIVIAHRLSTIINADRILVLDKGRVVQEGTYEELLRQPGPFSRLARRQLA
ncbi:MAG: NHLP bacteriocin export ABC transporter permease/ATPase subunit [Chloroflexota bacterium]